MATQSPSGSATDNAKEQVQEKAQDAQEKLKGGAQQARARMREQVDQRSTQVGTQVSSLAEALRRSGTDLQNEGNDKAAQLTSEVADRLERVGSYLEGVSGDEVMRDVESFARRRPWMLAGVGLLAGVAASRFMKASSEKRYDDSRALSQTGYSTSQASAGASQS